MGRPAHPDRPQAIELLRGGASTTDVAEWYQVSIQTARTWARIAHGPQRRRRKGRNQNSIGAKTDHRVSVLGGAADEPPIPLDEICIEARESLDDFELFRRRYFGRVSTPSQVEAAHRLLELWLSPEDERVVLNCPPGWGKSTEASDFACWVICWDRSVRILLTSASQRLAEKYSLRIRRSLERRFPMKASPRDKARGLAVDAEATLAGDFGRFRPESESLWRREEFVVEQLDGLALENKEPTVAAYGLDSDLIGHRADVVIADDLATPSNAKEGQERDSLLEKWPVIENRVEPGGLVVVIGQRLSAVDLSRHCLDQMSGMPDDEDDDEDVPLSGESHPVYRRIIYKAYYEDLDTGPESLLPSAPAYPNGPLLDPLRLSWRKIARTRHNKPSVFACQYQQEDGARADVLVQEIWVTGGVDEFGHLYPGCVDAGRRLWQVPDDLGPAASVASIDPGVAKNWAFLWELYQREDDVRHVVGLHHSPMSADDVLSWDRARRECRGLMVDWQLSSMELGRPIRFWVIEENIAKDFLTLAPIAEFMRRFETTVVKHSTHHHNKNHAELGIEVLVPQIWRHGHIRLPDRSHPEVEAFIQQHRTWRPGKRADTDYVMAGWFPELHWPRVLPPKPLLRLLVPDWVNREVNIA